ncbi:MAG: hypothetical protein QM765_29380 [Myxococcales bacterium]
MTLYEVLCGRRPFSADNEMTLLHAILHDEPAPLKEANPEVPDALCLVVERAMAKDRADRYPDARALGAALSDFLASYRPRMSAIEVAELVTQVRKARKPVSDVNPSGPKAVPGFPPEGVNALGNRPTLIVSSPVASEKTMAVPDSAILEEADRDTLAMDQAAALPAPKWKVPAMVVGGMVVSALTVALLLKPGTPPAVEPLSPSPAPPTAALPSPPPAPVPAPLPPPPAPVAVAVEPPPPPTPPAPPADPAPEPEPAPTPARAPLAKQPVPAERRPAARPAPAPKVAAAEPSAPKAAAKGVGLLNVNCNPWCHIYVDGADTGRDSPAAGIQLPAGKHKLRVVNPPTAVEQEREVEIVADQTTKMVVRF